LRDDNENTFWQYVPPSISREILITGQKELNHILLTSDSLNVFSSLYVLAHKWNGADDRLWLYVQATLEMIHIPPPKYLYEPEIRFMIYKKYSLKNSINRMDGFIFPSDL